MHNSEGVFVLAGSYLHLNDRLQSGIITLQQDNKDQMCSRKLLTKSLKITMTKDYKHQ